MKLIKLFAIMLAILAPLSSAWTVNVWSSDTHTANGTELTLCIRRMQATLEKHPNSTAHEGYRCGDFWIQWGEALGYVHEKTNLWLFNQCKDQIFDAALHSKDWVKCEVTGGFNKRMMAYSPHGKRACYKKDLNDHSPCKERKKKTKNPEKTIATTAVETITATIVQPTTSYREEVTTTQKPIVSTGIKESVITMTTKVPFTTTM
ncbi:hypothetical protein CB0940_12158 [Cercospora beticola]|uniref:Ecp2 effector protein domain-containing protein n=1 Tax=Cercospora beticola TaxID=122368 RepID=A0A2G5GIE4_CERBT|nr:hypothetical protein CB0940_12158 [Cercospora beticola]PIA80049.1 hypothetical protein CB0940_12158 [Cercospora beticola]WPB07659.1 hypothetical protein RHO25_012320 [Cercospora beticola]CAK1356537.1 unnamed protein product [Cercospora beticola]